MIPNIPRWEPAVVSPSDAPKVPETFSVQDGLAWLGISLEDYERAREITAGRHGNPFISALLDARAAQDNGETREAVLARHGIDLAEPLAVICEYDRHRSHFDS